MLTFDCNISTIHMQNWVQPQTMVERGRHADDLFGGKFKAIFVCPFTHSINCQLQLLFTPGHVAGWKTYLDVVDIQGIRNSRSNYLREGIYLDSKQSHTQHHTLGNTIFRNKHVWHGCEEPHLESAIWKKVLYVSQHTATSPITVPVT